MRLECIFAQLKVALQGFLSFYGLSGSTASTVAVPAPSVVVPAPAAAFPQAAVAVGPWPNGVQYELHTLPVCLIHITRYTHTSKQYMMWYSSSHYRQTGTHMHVCTFGEAACIKIICTVLHAGHIRVCLLCVFVKNRSGHMLVCACTMHSATCGHPLACVWTVHSAICGDTIFYDKLCY